MDKDNPEANEPVIFYAFLDKTNIEERSNHRIFGFNLDNISVGELFNATIITKPGSLESRVTKGTTADYLWVDNPETMKSLYDIAKYNNYDGTDKYKKIIDSLSERGIQLRNETIDIILK